MRVAKLKEEEFLAETFSVDDISKFARWKPKSKDWPKSKAVGPNLG